MKSGLKIFHWILFLWLCLLIINFDLVVSYISLIGKYIGLIIFDFNSALSVLTFSLVDAMLSTILFILLIATLIFFRRKFHFINFKLNFSFAVLFVIVFVFLFAPIITNENPDFSKNLSVTKLIPPLSSVRQLELKSSQVGKQSNLEKFQIESEKIIKPSFSDNIILADSVLVAEQVFVYQNNDSILVENEMLVSESGVPLVNDKFFLLGTDEFGRDIFARLIYGTRISITVGFGAVILSFLIGITLGFIAGYRGGIIDILLNRFTEMFLAFPVIYLVVLILALFSSSIFSVIIVLGISGWMSLFKIVKSEVVSIKQKDYFSTAKLVGLKDHQLLTKEILPVIITPVLVNLVFLFSNVILAEAALSYLGLGTGNNYPSWGSMISSGQEYITKAWWLITFPGLALILTLFTFNSSGKIFGKKLNSGIK